MTSTQTIRQTTPRIRKNDSVTVGGRERAMVLSNLLVMHGIPFSCTPLDEEFYKLAYPVRCHSAVLDMLGTLTPEHNLADWDKVYLSDLPL